MTDTIVALSSSVGKAAIAVIRLSGPRVREVVQAVAGGVPVPRRAAVRTLRDSGGETLDRSLVLFLPGPASFTGEDMAELHVHGGHAVVRGTLEALLGLPGVRAAEAGEFTRRAVGNGKLDLTAAEGIADLVAAETAGQRRQALDQAGGALERAVSGWRTELLRTVALVEAEIDFPDEGDVPQLYGMVRERAGVLSAEIAAALTGADRGERMRQGAQIVIAGPPNAGKSTLLNALARRDVAIVSPVAGTTRDAIEVHLDLDGYPVTLVDTAGMRETEDLVEGIGVERAQRRAAAADLVIWLSPADQPSAAPDFGTPVLPVASKVDAVDSPPEQHALAVSAVTGQGIDSLTEHMAEIARTVLEGSEPPLLTRARHRAELERARSHLRDAARADTSTPIEFVAEDLRLALRAFGRLTGAVDVDEIFDVIFREFCIGK